MGSTRFYGAVAHVYPSAADLALLVSRHLEPNWPGSSAQATPQGTTQLATLGSILGSQGLGADFSGSTAWKVRHLVYFVH